MGGAHYRGSLENVVEGTPTEERVDPHHAHEARECLVACAGIPNNPVAGSIGLV